MLSSDELQTLIQALSRDVIDAQIHWRLLKALHASAGKWPVVVHQSNTFWSLTFDAHRKVAIQAACRAYDTEPKSLNLYGLLTLISNNLHLFEEDSFRERLADNPFVDSLSESARKPDEKTLESDLSRCRPSEPLVKKLIVHRNNFVAHRGQKVAMQGAEMLAEFRLTVEEFEELIDRAKEILNRYSSLFSASTYSAQVIGHDDHETIFRWIQERIEREHLNYFPLIG